MTGYALSLWMTSGLRECMWICLSKARRAIVDAERQPIIEHREIYSGVFGRASISFFAFNNNGNRGIACSLNNLQKIKDGTPLGGHSRAEDDFADDDEDFLS